MPRIRAGHPSETHETAPEPRARTPKRRDPPGSPVPFPPGAVQWSIRSEAGEKLKAFVGDVEVGKFPIGTFTTTTILREWGPGTYNVGFWDRHGKAHGRTELKIGGEPRGAPEPVPAPASALATSDPMERAVQLLQSLKGIADADASRTVNTQLELIRSTNLTATELFRSAMGQRSEERAAAAAAMPAQLVDVLTKLDARLTQLSEEVADLREDIDGDPDDPEDPPRAASDGGGAPDFPQDWDGFGQFIYRMLVRQMPAIEKAAPELIKKFLESAQEAQRRAAFANGQPFPAAPGPVGSAGAGGTVAP
jgi:hypothetical protein